MSQEKETFASKMISSANELAAAYRNQQELFDVYFARGYNSGGGDPITDEDVAPAGLTAADVGSGITLAENFPKFMRGESSFTSDYKSTVNRLRNDL